MASIEVPSLNKAVADLLGMNAGLRIEQTKKGMRIRLDSEVEKMIKKDKAPDTLEKAAVRMLNAQGDVERLAFESDPTVANKYHSVYKAKTRLIPDKLLKRIAIQDDLVAAIVQARQNQMAAFGRPRPDRFSTGFVIEQRQETIEALEKIADPEEKKRRKEELQERIARVTKRMMTCGDDNLDLGGNQDDLTFPQYISMSVRNAVVLGRIATEVIWKRTTDGRSSPASASWTPAPSTRPSPRSRRSKPSVARPASSWPSSRTRSSTPSASSATSTSGSRSSTSARSRPSPTTSAWSTTSTPCPTSSWTATPSRRSTR
jgi:ribosomal 50S subunit-associated protein YjgA (DUF615 family)